MKVEMWEQCSYTVPTLRLPADAWEPPHGWGRTSASSRGKSPRLVPRLLSSGLKHPGIGKKHENPSSK